MFVPGSDHGGGGHSHFGGATYVGLLRSPFSAPLSPNDPILSVNWCLSLNSPPYFSQIDLSPKASQKFNIKLVISSDSVHNLQYKLLHLWDWNNSHWLKITFSPNETIESLDQNAASNLPPPGCKWAQMIISLLWTPPPPPRCIRAGLSPKGTPGTGPGDRGYYYIKLMRFMVCGTVLLSPGCFSLISTENRP